MLARTSPSKFVALSPDEWWSNAPERWLLSQTYHDVAAAIGWGNAIALGTWVSETKRPPSRAAGRRYDRRGILGISKQSKPSPVMREIASLIGDAAACALSREFGGEILQFGSIEPASYPRRNRAIVEQLDACGRAVVVACAFGMTERSIRRIYLSETGKSFVEPEYRSSERNAIAARRMNERRRKKS